MGGVPPLGGGLAAIYEGPKANFGPKGCFAVQKGVFLRFAVQNGVLPEKQANIGFFGPKMPFLDKK